MSAMLRFGEPEPRQALRRIRNQAALVRALLDEIERLAPAAEGCPMLAESVGTQLAEEVWRLGSRMLECARTIAGEQVRSEGSAAPPLLGADETR
jgi:hypothetical protein